MGEKQIQSLSDEKNLAQNKAAELVKQIKTLKAELQKARQELQEKSEPASVTPNVTSLFRNEPNTLSEDNVKAKVREYHISIDVPQRLIMHDCADWSRCAPAKQLCKHVGKVMMSLPDNISVSILRKIGADREQWEFKPYVA